MSIPNLPVDFKDDILNTGVNQKRKYQQTYNSDGSVSFEDVTEYQQKGSNFGAQEVNKTNGAVNNIYAERIVDLDELDLVTEPGFFVDALAVKELNSNSLKWLGYVDLSEKTSRIDNGTSQRLTYTYDVPEGTKYVLPLLKSCNWGSVGDTNYSNLLNGSFTATLVNISGDPHEITAKYRLIFLG